MVVLRVRFKYVYQLEFEFWVGFQCVTLLTCLSILLKKTDLSVTMINILIRTVKDVKTIIYLNEQVFGFQKLHAIFPKINIF